MIESVDYEGIRYYLQKSKIGPWYVWSISNGEYGLNFGGGGIMVVRSGTMSAWNTKKSALAVARKCGLLVDDEGWNDHD